MKVTILGCGSSGGVPLIGNNWGQCNPMNPRNRRTRVSVLVEDEGTSLLVDTSPDMRQQLLDCNLQNLSAVLYTHAHADHCHGIDELRSINWMMKKAVDVYADKETMHKLEQNFPYIFASSKPNVFHKPSIVPHIIDQAFQIENLNIIPFEQDHGYGISLGFRIGDFAYSTDAHNLSETAFAILKDVKIWAVDCIGYLPHHTHSHLEQTLKWIERVKPQQAYLTHMNETMDYDALMALLPPGVFPSYDGLVITC